MPDEPTRSRFSRQLAETALIRVVHHYGTRPEFVVLGGLVPELLCSETAIQHAGTIDIDVQVDLEVACSSVNATRLEQALRNAEFEPDSEKSWRWKAEDVPSSAIIKFELLADLQYVPNENTIAFEGCEALGAVNLRGTGFAARDTRVYELRSRVGGMMQKAEVLVAGTAGFLLAKIAAAYERRAQKDWYDIAFVLLYNDVGGPEAAARAVLDCFASDLPAMRVALDDLKANFGDPSAQGPSAFAGQMQIDHPEIASQTARADAILAVEAFHGSLFAT